MFKYEEPEKVFTPKGKYVNDRMYVHRDDLEYALRKALRKPKHIIIYGESGCGKTWLYKKVLKKQKLHYEVLNGATISSLGSVSDAIKSLSARIQPFERTAYEESKSASGNVAVAKGELKHNNKYEVMTSEPYLELVKKLFKIAGSKESILVIDNLEHIVKNEDHVRELSSILMYLDDDEYARYKVRVMLVGTPNNLRDYFSKVDSSQTIINRVQEIPEVSILETEKVKQLANRGFFNLVGLELESDLVSGFNKDYFLSAMSWFSTNVPQYIHELGLEISIEAKELNNGVINNDLYKNCLRNWVQEALVSENARVEEHINSKATKHGRRNQVIYCVGRMNSNEFSAQEVEDNVRSTFPVSTQNKTLNISAILKELSTGNNPLIRKSPKGTRYRFLDPKIKIMARWMLDKTDKENIEVKKFEESIKF